MCTVRGVIPKTGKAFAGLCEYMWLAPYYCLCFTPVTLWLTFAHLKGKNVTNYLLRTSRATPTLKLNTVQNFRITVILTMTTILRPTKVILIIYPLHILLAVGVKSF